MRCPSLAEIPPPLYGKTGWPWTLESQNLPESMPDGNPWPKLSIVTPSFNQGCFIEETIRSVLLQGYPNLEYMILDGGSTDNTVEIIRRYESWLSHWVSERDKGQASAINKGWSTARGQILGWLNSDDVYASDAFCAVAKAWCEAGRPGMAYGDAFSTNVRLHPLKKKRMNSYSLSVMLLGKRMPQPAVFICKDLFSTLGPLDESLYYSLDFDYFLRAWLQPNAEKYCYVPRVLAYSRRYADTKCQSGGWKRVEENVSVLKKIWNGRMQSYHGIREWRFGFATALAIMAERYLDNGIPLKAIRLYREAFTWSPRVVSNVLRSLVRLFIRKLLRRPVFWRNASSNASGKDLKIYMD
jgi:glycosyltransferase involved in cell wall biosynthesis